MKLAAVPLVTLLAFLAALPMQAQTPPTSAKATLMPTVKPGPDTLAPDIKPEALWDGRKIVPFHAIDNPKMVDAKAADFLDDDEYVLGLTAGGESRAYPTRFVWWHHVVNDKVGKAQFPVLVTYCSVCNTGIRFDPMVNGKTTLFGFYGLYNGVFIMFDRATDSVWLQVEGRAVKGTATGATLKMMPLLDTTWGEWKKRHPETLVMTPDNEYSKIYNPRGKLEPRGYDQFPAPFFQPSVTRGDLRLPPFDKVLAVTVPASAEPGPTANRVPASAGTNAPVLHRAYPIKTLKDAGGVVNDTLGNTPVAVLFDAQTVTANCVSRVLDGKTLTFENRKTADGKAAYYDKETATRWNIEGLAEEGPLMGKSLAVLDNHLSQWYGWSAYFPDTSIYGRTDAPQPGDPFAAK